jgi:dTDP-4-amino-4,6-dideoxygalactose transaminase
VTEGAKHSYKDFSVIIDPKEFGLDRNFLYDSLLKENILVKKYFYPPMHKVGAYKKKKIKLPTAEYVSENILSLPIYSYMEEEIIEKICHAIEKIYEFRTEINFQAIRR